MPLRAVVILPVTLAVVAFFCAPAANAFGDYEIVKATGDKVWRLDKQTGEISICTLDGTRLVCTPAEERAGEPVRVKRSRTYYVAPIPWRSVVVVKPHHGIRAKHRK